MTDLRSGCLDIGGFTFHPRTRLEEVKTYFGDKLRVMQLGDRTIAKLDGPYYVTPNIYAYSFMFTADGFIQSYTLYPVAPPMIRDEGNGEIPKYKLGVAKQWLQAMLQLMPQTANELSVGYTLSGVGYYAAVKEDVHYGLVGGDITVLFTGA